MLLQKNGEERDKGFLDKLGGVVARHPKLTWTGAWLGLGATIIAARALPNPQKEREDLVNQKSDPIDLRLAAFQDRRSGMFYPNLQTSRQQVESEICITGAKLEYIGATYMPALYPQLVELKPLADSGKVFTRYDVFRPVGEVGVPVDIENSKIAIFLEPHLNKITSEIGASATVKMRLHARNVAHIEGNTLILNPTILQDAEK